MPKSPSTSSVPGALIPLSLTGLAYIIYHTTSPPTPFTPPANSVLPSPVPTTTTLGPLTGLALSPLAQPLPTTAVNVYMSSPFTLTLAHFPLPLFHFVASDLLPPPTPDPSATGVCGPTQRSISQGGDPAGLELGAGWVEVALTRRQTMGWAYLDDTA
jgi:hypothetical protein